MTALAARERLAQTLIPVAAELAATVRDYGPDDVAAVLTRVDPEALPALAVVLAAMVDVERTPTELLAWMDRGPQVYVPGTAREAHAAWNRGVHTPEVQAGERAYQTARGRRRRASERARRREGDAA